jgi:hypothetical protein
MFVKQMTNRKGYLVMTRHPDDNTHLATDGEAMQEYAHNIGGEYPDRAWLLTSYDVWVRNPAYVGPPVPHPEDYSDYGPLDEGDGPREDFSLDGGECDDNPPSDDDIPF